MFDKTKKNFNRLKNEGIFAWKLISGVFSVWFDIVILAYYILANVFALGNRIINIIMLSLSILILIVDIFYWSKDKRKRKKIKKEYKETKKLLFYAKITTSAVSLGLTIYSIVITVNNVSPLRIVLTTALVILWIERVIFEIIKEIIIKQFKDLFVGIPEGFMEVATNIKDSTIVAYDKTKDFIGNTVETVKETTTETVSKIKNFFHKKEDKKQIEK